ncbi:hypothetical protein [Stenotrophomonas phage vB_SmaS_BUCT548]|uniref:Uncharacterized protein n=1 Tax=Stenotrophomonas phage vB_SmaS_BUCT548 TaxID=2712941 RepID=A0A7D2LFM8_9CAUD|nr:hypothetical protein PQD75_gp074 [Stenotrophomonas phage vB_SmaS_BUCT548]QIQ60798.1 hypothetical protein [Stenotrophomonas phage vB_SmaS_BUCT548]
MVIDGNVSKTYHLDLELTEYEARMLMALFQNAAGEGEPKEARAIREAVFSKLYALGARV